MQPEAKRFRDMDQAEIANALEELWSLIRQLDR
jgi:hypothetical protein